MASSGIQIAYASWTKVEPFWPFLNFVEYVARHDITRTCILRNAFSNFACSIFLMNNKLKFFFVFIKLDYIIHDVG